MNWDKFMYRVPVTREAEFWQLVYQPVTEEHTANPETWIARGDALIDDILNTAPRDNPESEKWDNRRAVR